VAPPQFVVGDRKSQLGKASEQCPEREAPLESGKWRTEAVMDAVSEREVTGARTVDVEHLGMLEDVFIVTRG
jgi:hypothetical protein